VTTHLCYALCANLEVEEDGELDSPRYTMDSELRDNDVFGHLFKTKGGPIVLGEEEP